MEQKLVIYNTLSRQKETFEPLNAPNVGMYVCGPTVYGDGHLGHARPAITFDLVFRYLKHIGYKVRYVRNITDVGHLENDADEGDDKIAKKARLEQLEPMEVVQYYVLRYRKAMAALNILPPSIEPHASGHIIEQIEFINEILKNDYAYESNESIYFDVAKYNQNYNYSILSHRNIEELKANTRQLDGQSEKRNSFDFALWKRASPEHIMRWKALFKWTEFIDGEKKQKQKQSVGFPGWHIECSAMSAKYLGKDFDIHGGGMDLVFPHHECEIAQNTAVEQHQNVKYWMHNNMITINGQKMGKSIGNFITLDDFFSGEHKLLNKAYSPMTIRFFIMQAHYRSTLDFSNEALLAAEKALERLMDAYAKISKLEASPISNNTISAIKQKCYDAMNDDLNSAIVLSHLFEAATIINTAWDGKLELSQQNIDELGDLFQTFLFDILGVSNEATGNNVNHAAFGKAIDMLLEIRAEAKVNKDWATSDKIRNELTALGFEIKDGKDGAEWKLK